MLTAGEIFFTLLYTAIFTFIILKVSFFKSFGLPAPVVAAVFLFKIVSGILYGVIHYYLYQGGDTFSYFNDGKIVFASIDSKGWSMYMRLVFGFTKPEPASDIIPFRDAMSYYTIMNSYFMVRFHALADLITGGHYYANMVIYNFLTLIGLLYLFRFCYHFLPDKKNWIIACLFIFPSVAFWSSGIHKDGISLATLGLILYFISQLMTKKLPREKIVKSTGGALIGLWLLFVVRDYLLMLIFPCIVGFIWTMKSPKYAAVKYLTVFILFYTVVFNLQWINPSWDLLREMSDMQEEFSHLAIGASSRQLPTIDSQSIRLISLIPLAIYHCLFLPLPWSITSIMQLVPAVDNLIVLILIASVILFIRHNRINEKSFMLFCLLFALSVFGFTGSIVPNIGALVRYKMPGEVFLLMGILAAMDSDKINRYLEVMPKHKIPKAAEN